MWILLVFLSVHICIFICHKILKPIYHIMWLNFTQIFFFECDIVIKFQSKYSTLYICIPLTAVLARLFIFSIGVKVRPHENMHKLSICARFACERTTKYRVCSVWRRLSNLPCFCATDLGSGFSLMIRWTLMNDVYMYIKIVLSN